MIVNRSRPNLDADPLTWPPLLDAEARSRECGRSNQPALIPYWRFSAGTRPFVWRSASIRPDMLLLVDSPAECEWVLTRMYSRVL